MHITLIHNPTAGYEGHSAEQLLLLLQRAGYEPFYQSSHEKHWKRALDEPGELVVVAGGDGTVDAVAIQLVDRNIPLAILPCGTANNIATSLGIIGTPEEIIAGWKTGHSLAFDVGIAKGPWGEVRFVESAGFGIFAHMMPILNVLGKRQFHTNREDHLRYELQTLFALIDACRATPWELELDGKDASGKFLMCEVMNITMLGPGLKLSPQGDPGDGLLDIVLIEKEHRQILKDYLAEIILKKRPSVELPVRQARQVDFRWNGSVIHVDSLLWGAGPDRLINVRRSTQRFRGRVQITLHAGAIKVLVP